MILFTFLKISDFRIKLIVQSTLCKSMMKFLYFSNWIASLTYTQIYTELRNFEVIEKREHFKISFYSHIRYLSCVYVLLEIMIIIF